MTIEELKKFLGFLGVHNVEAGSGEWARASCPLARFTHGGGNDSHPSFGAVVGSEPRFNCYTCEHGSMEYLLQVLQFHLQQSPQFAMFYDMVSAKAILDGSTVEVPPLPEYTEFALTSAHEFEEWPLWFVHSLPAWDLSVQSVAYLKGRGVPKWVADHFDLRWDEEKRMVVSPYRNVYGKLAGMRGRSVDKDCPKHKRFHDYKWNGVNNASLCWYNEPVLESLMPVVMVEGQFDLYQVFQVTEHVIAGLSAKVTAFKMKRLLQSEAVLLMLDPNKTGEQAKQKYAKYLGEHGVKVGVIDIPAECEDPGVTPLEWLRETLKDVVPVRNF